MASTNEKISFLATQVAMSTGNPKDLKVQEAINVANEEANTVFHAGLFSLLSNIKQIAQYIGKAAKYLFPLAFAFKATDWLLYLWKFLRTGNQNIGKTNNVLLKTILTALLGLVVFGGGVIALGTGHILFAGILGIDVAFNFGKLIYFGYSAFKAKDPVAKDFYFQKTKESAIKTVVGGILLAGIIVSLIFGSPILPAAVVATTAIAGVAALIFVGASALFNYFKPKPISNPVEVFKKMQTLEPVSQPTVKLAQGQQQTLLANAKSSQFQVSRDGFFANKISLLQPLSEDLQQEIRNLKMQISIQVSNLTRQIDTSKNTLTEKYLWGQNDKRDSKLDALTFLSTVLSQFTLIQANMEKGKPVIINGKVFKGYRHVGELIQKIDHHVLKRHGKAYQSFFQDIGGVEALFKQAYKLMTAANLKKVAESDVQRRHLTHP